MSITTAKTTTTATSDKHDDGLAWAFENAVKRIFTAYTVDMTRPAAATQGGPHTLQRIRLVMSNGTALLIGWVNLAQGRAQLHTLGHTLSLSKQRFGREIVMPPLEYLRFLETAKTVLEEHGISVEVVAFTKQGAPSGTRPRVDAPARSRTLPFYVVDALAAATSLVTRVMA